jgi:hypothetical protein
MPETIPALPEGFTLDQPQQVQGSIPPLPNGFTLDQAEQIQQPQAIQQAQATQETQPLPTPQQPITNQPYSLDQFGRDIVGGAEGALSLASGFAAAPVAGIVGLADAANPFTEEGAGSARIKQVQEAMTYQPRTEEGKQALQPVQKAFEKVEKVKESLGEDTLKATGSPLLAAISHTLPDATLSLFGIKSIMPRAKPVGNVSTNALEAAPESADIAKIQTPAMKKITQLLIDESKNASTAKYKLSETSDFVKNLGLGAEKAVKDPIAIAAVKQGFDLGVVAAVKGSTALDKAKMLKMVNITKDTLENKLFGQKNRATDVVGDTLMKRVDAVYKANNRAGSSIDKAANRLKRVDIDKGEIVAKFDNSLDKIGVKIDPKGKLSFKGSDIEGVAPAERLVKVIYNRLKSIPENDAIALHKLKRFIDEHVSYGKSTEGLSGKTEGMIKKLRSEIDASLDGKSPIYDKANTAYSETIGALNSLKDVAGKKMDLSGLNANKATGTLLRRIMGNAQSRIPLMDALTEIEGVAQKYGKITKGKEDIFTQILFADELDRIFNTTARTSFKGQIEQASPQVPMTMTGAMVEGGKYIYKKAQNINESSAFKTIEELLKAEKK